MVRPVLVAAALTALAASLAVSGTSAAAPSAVTALPAKLVGTYSRTVTRADQRRVSGSQPQLGRWTITVKKNGVILFVWEGGFSITERLFSLSNNRVRIYISQCPRGIYRWKRAGNRLTFTKISENTGSRSCLDREAIFAGVWTKK